MRLTAFTDYTLRVLIYLAARPERRATIAEIAADFGISEHHLVKVVHALGRSGLVATVRGKGGGLQLGRPASQINVGAVVREAEGPTIAAECFDAAGNHCSIVPVCRLRGVLAEAVAAFQAVLARYTLQDLVRNPDALASVMFLTRPEAGLKGRAHATRR